MYKQNQDSFKYPRRPNTHSKYPIPRGNSYYAEAKRAEYIEKDLEKAASLYLKEINSGERKESAVKDLAVVMHQQGKTEQGCELLRKYVDLFKFDTQKYENLLSRLQSQVVPSEKCLNKNLKISNLKRTDNERTIKRLFENPVRIQSITFGEECGVYYAVLKFLSHSSARKTLETMVSCPNLNVEYLSIGEQTKPVVNKSPAFPCKLFLSGMEAIDAHYDTKEGENINGDELSAILGTSLWNDCCLESPMKRFNMAAAVYVPTFTWGN